MLKKAFTPAADYEAPMQAFIALTRAAIESGEKFVELNLRQSRSRLEESSDAIRELMSAKDAQGYAAFAATHIQPEFNRAMEHYLELTGIARAMQASVTKILSTSLQATGTK